MPPATTQLPPDEKLGWSVRETAAQLGLSENNVRAAIARGEIPAHRFGSRLVIPADFLRRQFTTQ